MNVPVPSPRGSAGQPCQFGLAAPRSACLVHAGPEAVAELCLGRSVAPCGAMPGSDCARGAIAHAPMQLQAMRERVKGTPASAKAGLMVFCELAPGSR